MDNLEGSSIYDLIVDDAYLFYQVIPPCLHEILHAVPVCCLCTSLTCTNKRLWINNIQILS